MKKTTNEVFKEWLDKVPYGEYTETVEKLATHCGVTPGVVCFWKTGKTKIKHAYQKLINEFADKKIFTLKP